MPESTLLSTEPDAKARPQPGDGKGPDRLRESLADSREGKKRGAYRCRECGTRHAEGTPCGPISRARPSPQPAAAPIFTEANTARLLRVPFSIAAIRTQCSIWILAPEEEAELVASAVPCLNEWVAIHPKWAALFMFSWSLGSLAVGKALGYSAWRAAMIEEYKASEAQRKVPAQKPLPENVPPGFMPTEKPPSPRSA